MKQITWWDCGETSPKYYFKVEFGSAHLPCFHPPQFPTEIQTFAHRRQWSCRWLAAHNWQSHRIAPGASTAPTERRKDVVPSAEMYECDCMCWHWSSLGNMAQISNQWTCQWKQCRMLWMKHFGELSCKVPVENHLDVEKSIEHSDSFTFQVAMFLKAIPFPLARQLE